MGTRKESGMEIPKRTWDHIVDLMRVIEEYPTHTQYLNAVEQIIDLVSTVIQDSKRELPCQD